MLTEVDCVVVFGVKVTVDEPVQSLGSVRNGKALTSIVPESAVFEPFR